MVGSESSDPVTTTPLERRKSFFGIWDDSDTLNLYQPVGPAYRSGHDKEWFITEAFFHVVTDWPGHHLAKD
jgi:hypothetical protein